MLVALIGVLLILLKVIWWILVIQIVLSLLIAFNVINTQNEVVRSIWNALGQMTEPLYRPIRRVLPDFGALDLSPLIVLLILYILMNIVIPSLYVAPAYPV